MEILIIWNIYVAAIITLKTSQNQLWVKLVTGTKEDTNWPHCVPEERQRSHARTSKQRPNAQICNCSIKQETEAETEMWQRLRKGGGDRRQSERDRRSVTKTKRQCTKFPDRVPGMGETVDDHRQPGNPSILYSVFWPVANPPCSDFHPSHHHVHPMRRKVAYVACLDHYGLWMGSSFDGPSHRHFSLFILGQKFHSWMAIFALAPPRVWFCNKHSTCTLASPSLNCSWWRPSWTPLHPLHPN